MTNITVLQNLTPDYTGDKFSALQLCRNIEKYYRENYDIDVKAWLECINLKGRRQRWEIRSNIKLVVPSFT